MRRCSYCHTMVSEDYQFCPECGRPLAIGQDIRGKVTYSKALRWISGVFGLWSILAAINGLTYFAASGLSSELIVDMISIVVGVVLLLIASVPNWVRSTFKIKLEKGSVFGATVVVLVIVFFIATALGPEPPGGWWNW